MPCLFSRTCLFLLSACVAIISAESVSSSTSLAASTTTPAAQASDATETRIIHITSTSTAVDIESITTDPATNLVSKSTLPNTSASQTTSSASTITSAPSIYVTTYTVATLGSTTTFATTFTVGQDWHIDRPVLILTMNSDDLVSAFMIQKFEGRTLQLFDGYILGYKTHTQTLTYGEVITVADNAVSLQTTNPGIIFWTPLTSSVAASSTTASSAVLATVTSTSTTRLNTTTTSSTRRRSSTTEIYSTPSQLETTYVGAVPSSYDVNSVGMLYSATASASSTANAGNSFGHGGAVVSIWWGFFAGLVVFGFAAFL